MQHSLSNPARTMLITAAILSTGMALFHFFIPYLYPWEARVGGLYPPVRWALFAINFAYSTFLLWAGLLALLLWLSPSGDRRLTLGIVGGIGLCWLAGAVYEFLVPFPVAEVRWVLPIFALVSGGLYLYPAGEMVKRTRVP